MKYINMANHVQSDNQPEILLTMVDLSGSMFADDIKPNRKEAAVRANEKIVQVKKQSYPDDKIGVISFQRTAKLSLVPTYSKDIDNLNEAINDIGLKGGTDFTAPLTLAYNYFAGKQNILRKSPIKNMLSLIFFEQNFDTDTLENGKATKRIILLTDGEHLGRISPIDIANKLKDIGVTIDCIGIGGSRKDVDEKLLKQIASRNPNGSIRYCFIGDQQKLLKKYSSLAHHIKAI